jgi:hypothetical protein
MVSMMNYFIQNLYMQVFVKDWNKRNGTHIFAEDRNTSIEKDAASVTRTGTRELKRMQHL